MATRWVDRVRTTKQLSVFAGPLLEADATWTKVFSDALQEFNSLSRSLSLGVTMVQVKTPPTQGPGGADVEMEIGGGSLSFPFGKGQITVRNVDPNSLEGTAQPIGEPNEGGPLIKNVFIVLPKTPRLPSSTTREVGPPVKLCIAVHELFHACGLDNSDHTLDDIMACLNADVRTGKSPKDPKDPANDLFVAPNGKEMPPIFVGPGTARKVKALWT